jgi:uncharacterized protein
MAMSREEMDRRMDEHFGFEARDDVRGVLGTLTDDVAHDVVGWPAGPSRGREQARGFYEALFSDLADSEFTCVRRLYGDDFLVDESRWSGRAVGRPFGLEGRGRPLNFRLLHVVRFDEDRQLAAEQVWVDLAAIQAQLPQD